MENGTFLSVACILYALSSGLLSQKISPPIIRRDGGCSGPSQWTSGTLDCLGVPAAIELTIHSQTMSAPITSVTPTKLVTSMFGMELAVFSELINWL